MLYVKFDVWLVHNVSHVRQLLAVSEAQLCGAHAFVAVCDTSLGLPVRGAKYKLLVPTPHVFPPKPLFKP